MHQIISNGAGAAEWVPGTEEEFGAEPSRPPLRRHRGNRFIIQLLFAGIVQESLGAPIARRIGASQSGRKTGAHFLPGSPEADHEAA